jgi:hypothetical protein
MRQSFPLLREARMPGLLPEIVDAMPGLGPRTACPRRLRTTGLRSPRRPLGPWKSLVVVCMNAPRTMQPPRSIRRTLHQRPPAPDSGACVWVGEDRHPVPDDGASHPLQDAPGWSWGGWRTGRQGQRGPKDRAPPSTHTRIALPSSPASCLCHRLDGHERVGGQAGAHQQGWSWAFSRLHTHSLGARCPRS